MLAQAAGFALLATISPAALAVMAVFLASANPRQAGLMHVAGALVMTAVMAVAMLVIIRASGLNLRRGYDARYGLRLAIGILAVAGAAVVSRRTPWASRTLGDSRTLSDSRTDQPGNGLISRLVARPTARAAFVAGLILFVPSATFIAAVQVIATADAGFPLTVLGLSVVIVLSPMIAWLPMVAYLAASDATVRRLAAANDWLRVRGRMLVVAALVICGIVLVINGALGLAASGGAASGGG